MATNQPPRAKALCARIKDIPAGVWLAGTVKRPCARCAEEVAVAPSTLKLFATYPGLELVCNRCMATEPGSHVPVVTQEAIAEAKGIDAAPENN